LSFSSVTGLERGRLFLFPRTMLEPVLNHAVS
jgi:hypothetical protein